MGERAYNIQRMSLADLDTAIDWAAREGWSGRFQLSKPDGQGINSGSGLPRRACSSAITSQMMRLHGDIHHDNILDFGRRGWLAIDPKRLFGERGFDYANLFCNPDLSDPSHPVATAGSVRETAGDRRRAVGTRAPASAAMDHRLVRFVGGLVHR
jgi:hypothetical protein